MLYLILKPNIRDIYDMLKISNQICMLDIFTTMAVTLFAYISYVFWAHIFTSPKHL